MLECDTNLRQQNFRLSAEDAPNFCYRALNRLTTRSGYASKVDLVPGSSVLVRVG